MRTLLLFLAATFVFQASSSAEMVATQDMPVDAIIKVLNREAKTEQQRQVLSLTKFAANALAIKKVETIQGQTPEQVNVSAVREAIRRAIYARAWDQKIAPQEVAYLSQNRDFLKTTFGAETNTWVWMSHQIGESAQIKDQLLARYEAEFKRVMRMVEQPFFGGSPIIEAEAILAALKTQITPEQKSEIENKMRQMKAHVSQIPDSGIVT